MFLGHVRRFRGESRALLGAIGVADCGRPRPRQPAALAPTRHEQHNQHYEESEDDALPLS
jgi:hypothetical protein